MAFITGSDEDSMLEYILFPKLINYIMIYQEEIY